MIFFGNKHRKYMELLSRIRKVESMKDTFENITATDDYKSGLEDGLEWALAVLMDREADLQLKIEKFPACSNRTGNMNNKSFLL